MKKLIYILFWIPGLLLLSCQEEIDLDLQQQEKQKVVVQAFITDEMKIQTVKLTGTTNYYDPEQVPPIMDAQVSIVGDSTTFQFVENQHPDSLEYYHSKVAFAGKPGIEYSIKITYEGEEYSATSHLDPVPPIDSLDFSLSPIYEAGLTSDTVYQIDMFYKEPAPAGDYYLVDIFVNNNQLTNTPQQKAFYDDESLEGDINLAVYNLSLYDDVVVGDTVKVRLSSISKTGFEFYEVFVNQTDLSGNPFAGAPPANMPTNMNNGAIGLFQASSVVEYERIFKP